MNINYREFTKIEILYCQSSLFCGLFAGFIRTSVLPFIVFVRDTIYRILYTCTLSLYLNIVVKNPLGIYLFKRARKRGDKRFDKYAENWWGMRSGSKVLQEIARRNVINMTSQKYTICASNRLGLCDASANYDIERIRRAKS